MRIQVHDGVMESIPGVGSRQILEDYLANPEDFDVALPRYASTVMLVRDSFPGQTEYRIEDGVMPPLFPTSQSIEVFMLRRVKTMAFSPDAVVYPGGRVDESDKQDVPWFGPPPAQWSEFMNVPEGIARQCVVTAARELFEECGVLLAGPDGETLLNDLSDPVWAAEREALENHETSFGDMLLRHKLVLRADQLGLISNICTPKYSPRRYDTFFFSALLPDGQAPDDKTSEARIADWVTPAYAMRESDAGRWKVLPPTMFNLTAVALADTAESFVARRHNVTRLLSYPVKLPNGALVQYANLPAEEEARLAPIFPVSEDFVIPEPFSAPTDPRKKAN